MSVIEKEFKGNVGLFLVCAELSKHNLVAMPTSRNTKGHDLVVLNPETNKAVGIQVKCTDRKEFPILSSHWKDYIQNIESKILSDFVLVWISDPNRPEYFILSEAEIKSLLKSKIEEYSVRYQRKNSLNWEQLLEEEEREKKSRNLWVLKLSDVEGKGYKGKWETITNRLQNPER